MIVTGTEAVTKTKYKVYIDGQFAFVLYKGELSRYQVQEGREITKETCDRIRGEVLVKRAKLRAMHLLNAMGRTESQLREKLTQGGYPEDVVDEALSYVKSFGYVDDVNYARSFTDSRKDKKSRREIEMLLKGKGISGEDIEKAMEECYGEDTAMQAVRKLMKKRRYIPGESSYEEKQRFMAYVMRKGFSYDDVCRALEEDSEDGA
ncbi:MAG: recombination regulator RecX [Lachnospiraceae bacterium]